MPHSSASRFLYIKMTEVPNWIRIGAYIDAKDSMNDWCVAKVIEVSPVLGKVTVVYDGWGNSRQCMYSLSSSKIAPFRKNSRGYLGPRRMAYRDWEFDRAELTIIQTFLQEKLSGDLLLGTAFDTTQFYRGTLWIYIENLLA